MQGRKEINTEFSVPLFKLPSLKHCHIVSITFAGSLPSSTTNTPTSWQENTFPGSTSSVIQTEIIIYVVSSIVLVLIVCGIIFACVKLRRRKGKVKLPDAKYDVASDQVNVQPQRFATRTVSVSSTGSAAMFLRQRSFRNRLDSRLTNVRF